jgi:DNA helicase INO80
LLAAAELEGDGEAVPVLSGVRTFDAEDLGPLPDINFDDGEYSGHGHTLNFIPTLSAEDHSNLHRHARQNAQEAIALAKQRAEQFDAQAALARKTNEALKLAKAQFHDREDSLEERQTDEASIEPSNSKEPKSQLVDCELKWRQLYL